MSSLFEFALLVLAAWRITSLISQEDGPWDMFAKFRNVVGVRYDEYSQPTKFEGRFAWFAKGIICMWCASVWVAFAAAFFSPYTANILSFIINWFAISGLIIATDEAINLIARGARR